MPHGRLFRADSALKDGLELAGPLPAVSLVENLGAFCDLPAIDGWLFVHVAGWDTATVSRLLEGLARVPVLHFGDLDPNGVRIFQHLRRQHPRLRWFVPSFWEELVESKGLRGDWPDDLALDDAPTLVRELVARGLWLEQEALVVDPRTPSALEAML
jgi:hypothetical protein